MTDDRMTLNNMFLPLLLFHIVRHVNGAIRSIRRTTMHFSFYACPGNMQKFMIVSAFFAAGGGQAPYALDPRP